MKRYKIKDTVKGLCLVFLGIGIWKSARGAAIFLLIMENDDLYTEWKNLEVGCWSVIEKTFVITAM